MKKLVSVLLVLAVVTCAFAGVWSTSVKVGYDNLNYNYNLKNLSFTAQTDYNEEKGVWEDELSRNDVDSALINIYLDYAPEGLSGFVKNINFNFGGASATIEAAAKVAKDWAVFANATYILEDKLTLDLNKIGAGIYPPVNKDASYINDVKVVISKHQINKLVKNIVDLANASDEGLFVFDDDEYEGEEVFAKLYMNGMRADAGVAYSYKLKDFEFIGKAAVEFNASFLHVYGSVEYEVEIGDKEETFKDYAKASANFFNFGVTAEADVRYNINKTLAVEAGVVGNAGLFNLMHVKAGYFDAYEDVENYKPEYVKLFNGNAFSFGFAPSISVRTGLVIKF